MVIVFEIYVVFLLQAIIQYLKNENWINPSISCQILKREVKFKPLTDDSVAKLCIVDESTDNKIIKFYDTKVCYICTYLSMCKVLIILYYRFQSAR